MRRSAAVLALAMLAACAAGPDPGGPTGVPTCEIRFAAPPGFAPSETFEQPYADRIGVRLGYVDTARHELHVFAGIPGEFGEGLPAGGSIVLADGGTGVVLGRGDVWVVRWEEGDHCDPRAVLVNGFDRNGFESLLADAGLVAAR